MCTPSFSNDSFSIQKVAISSDNIFFQYLITTTIPSNAPFKRIWCLNATGTIANNDNVRAVLNYKAAETTCDKYTIKFDGPISGTLILNNTFFSAQKYMKYSFDDIAQIFILEISIPGKVDKPKCYPMNYEFVIYIPDSSNQNVYELVYGQNSSVNGIYNYTTGPPDQLMIDNTNIDLTFSYSSIEPNSVIIVDTQEQNTVNTLYIILSRYFCIVYNGFRLLFRNKVQIIYPTYHRRIQTGLFMFHSIYLLQQQLQQIF